jgi:nicotinamide mononucleotide transporter
MDPLELSGAVIGVVGVWLMIRQRVAAWPVGMIQVALYAWIFFQARVYSSALLQGVFFAILLYGWWHWRRGSRTGLAAPAAARTSAGMGGSASAEANGGASAEPNAPARAVADGNRELRVTRLGAAGWLAAVAVGTLVTVAWGMFLGRTTDAVLPFWDAGVLGFSLVAQWLQARKKRENWLFWSGVNAVALGLYFSQGLRVTAVLYAVFLGLAVFGWRAWGDSGAQEERP